MAGNTQVCVPGVAVMTAFVCGLMPKTLVTGVVAATAKGMRLTTSDSTGRWAFVKHVNTLNWYRSKSGLYAESKHRSKPMGRQTSLGRRGAVSGLTGHRATSGHQRDK